MKFKKTLVKAAILFAVISVGGGIGVALLPAGTVLMKLCTIATLFAFIGLLACMKAIGEINWQNENSTKKISEAEEKYRSTAKDWTN